MDIKGFLDAADERDFMFTNALRDALSNEHRQATIKAIAWAIETDRHICEVFYDFKDYRVSLTKLSVFANSARQSEWGGDFCYAQKTDGSLVIALFNPDDTDRLSCYRNLTPRPDITCFEDFKEAREKLERAAEPQTL